MPIELTVATPTRECLIDVTSQVQRVVTSEGLRDGLITLFVPHTTAGITINENADPTVCSDMLEGLARIAPHTQPFYEHDEGNSAAHIKSSLLGPSLTVIVENGCLLMGTWQGIYFAEFDGPRTRTLWIKKH